MANIMPVPTKAFVDMYILKAEAHIATLQAELDNLTDGNCPE